MNAPARTLLLVALALGAVLAVVLLAGLGDDASLRAGATPHAGPARPDPRDVPAVPSLSGTLGEAEPEYRFTPPRPDLVPERDLRGYRSTTIVARLVVTPRLWTELDEVTVFAEEAAGARPHRVERTVPCEGGTPRVTFEGLPVSSAGWRVGATSAIADAIDVYPVLVGDGAELHGDAELPLVRRGSLDVQVVDVAGAPVAGLAVAILHGEGDDATRQERTTDDRGRAGLERAAPGAYRVEVRSDTGVLATATRAHEPGAATQLRIEVPVGRPVRIEVYDEHGVPLPDVALRLSEVRSLDGVDLRTTADHGGLARLAHVPVGEYHVEARRGDAVLHVWRGLAVRADHAGEAWRLRVER